SEAHVRQCREAGTITKLEAFPGNATPLDESPNPEQGSNAPEPSAFAALDSDYAAACAAAQVDVALDESHVDAVLPKLLQAGLDSWIYENNRSKSFAVDPLPGRNPSLHARL